MSRKPEGQKTVYAVVSGEYSDYRIHCLFPTRRKAQAHADRRNRIEGCDAYDYGAHQVETHTLHENGEPEAVTIWIATGDYGPRSQRTVSSNKRIVWDGSEKPPARPYVNAHPLRNGCGFVWGKAATEEAALKAVADRIARLNAEIEGVG